MCNNWNNKLIYKIHDDNKKLCKIYTQVKQQSNGIHESSAELNERVVLEIHKDTNKCCFLLQFLIHKGRKNIELQLAVRKDNKENISKATQFYIFIGIYPDFE